MLNFVDGWLMEMSQLSPPDWAFWQCRLMLWSEVLPVAYSWPDLRWDLWLNGACWIFFSEAPSPPLWESWDYMRFALNINEDSKGSLFLWFSRLLPDRCNYDLGPGRDVYIAIKYTHTPSGDYYHAQRSWWKDTECFLRWETCQRKLLFVFFLQMIKAF